MLALQFKLSWVACETVIESPPEREIEETSICCCKSELTAKERDEIRDIIGGYIIARYFFCEKYV